MKKFLAVLLSAFLTLSSFGLVFAEKVDATRNGVGINIADFSTRDLYGNDVTGEIFGDAVCTVINEWATWCVPCVAELPHFQELHEHYSSTPESDVQVLGAVYVSVSCTPESARALVEEQGYTFTNVLLDTVLDSAFDTQTNGVPATLIVDRHGVVRAHVNGSFSSSEQLRGFVDSWYEILLQEEDQGASGDINGNGVVEMLDAVLALRMSMNIIAPYNVSAGDVNGNGVIDMSDAVVILRMSMGISN